MKFQSTSSIKVDRAPASSIKSAISSLVSNSKTSVPKLDYFGLKSGMQILQHSNPRRLLNVHIVQSGSEMPHFLIHFGDNMEAAVMNFIERNGLLKYTSKLPESFADTGAGVAIPVNRFTERRLAQLERLAHTDVHVGF